MKLLSVYCEEQGIDLDVASRAAREGRIDGAVKEGQGRGWTHPWWVPTECGWKPGERGRPRKPHVDVYDNKPVVNVVNQVVDATPRSIKSRLPPFRPPVPGDLITVQLTWSTKEWVDVRVKSVGCERSGPETFYWWPVGDPPFLPVAWRPAPTGLMFAGYGWCWMYTKDAPPFRSELGRGQPDVR